MVELLSMRFVYQHVFALFHALTKNLVGLIVFFFFFFIFSILFLSLLFLNLLDEFSVDGMHRIFVLSNHIKWIKFEI